MVILKMRRAAGYIRVSSKAQSDNGESLSLQERVITDHIRAKGWELSEIYADKGVSGKSIEGRKALQKLLSDAKNGLIDVVVIHSLSRFGRNTKDLLSNLYDLKSYNVSLVSLKEEIDYSTFSGELIYTIFAAISTLEREVIRERTMENRISRGQRGVPTGGTLPFARTFDKTTGNWSLDEKKADLIRWAANQYLHEGQSLHDISHTLKTRHKLNASYKYLITILRDRSSDKWTITYKNQEPITYNVPRILDDITIQAIKNRLAHNRVHNRQDVKKYVLTGFLRCYICLKSLSGQTQINRVGSKFEYYRHPGGKYEPCKAMNSIPLRIIETTVFRSIFDNFYDEPSFDMAIKDFLPDKDHIDQLKESIRVAKSELKKVVADLDKLVDLALKGTLKRETIQKKEDELCKAKLQLEEQIERDEIRLSSLPSTEKILAEAEVIRRQMMHYYRSTEHIAAMTFEEKKRLLHWLFDGKDNEGTPYGIYIEKKGDRAWDCFIYGKLIHGITEAYANEEVYKTSYQGCPDHHDLHAHREEHYPQRGQKPT